MAGESRVKVDAKIVRGATEGWFKPGAGKAEWFKDLDVGPEMVVLPAGRFTMGSSRSEIAALNEDYGNDWPDAEGPQRSVAIKVPFAVGRFAITFDEWDAAGLSHRPADLWGRGRWPVIKVSWEDAKAYIRWLSETTGKTYQLLSEAEWEYCCRAGTTTSFWWGNSISTAQAKYNGNSTFGGSSRGEYRCLTVGLTASSQTHGASIRCTATSGSGARTIGTRITKVPLRMARSGPKAMPLSVFCAVGPGSGLRSNSARPTASLVYPTSGKTLSGSVLPERCDVK